MDSKLLYKQIKEQLFPMEGVAVMVEDDKMNFYVNGRLEFYVRESGGVSFVPNCFFGTYNSDTFSYTNRLSAIP